MPVVLRNVRHLDKCMERPELRRSTFILLAWRYTVRIYYILGDSTNKMVQTFAFTNLCLLFYVDLFPLNVGPRCRLLAANTSGEDFTTAEAKLHMSCGGYVVLLIILR